MNAVEQGSRFVARLCNCISRFGVWGLGFGVWGLGFRVWGLGVGDLGLGFGVWDLGFRVWGLCDQYLKPRSRSNSPQWRQQQDICKAHFPPQSTTTFQFSPHPSSPSQLPLHCFLFSPCASSTQHVTSHVTHHPPPIAPHTTTTPHPPLQELRSSSGGSTLQTQSPSLYERIVTLTQV